ncbi:MAG: MFS transporter [Jatrophihabitantaceae bacterium]
MATDIRATVGEDLPSSVFSGRLRNTTIGLITVVTMIAFEAMAVTPALPTAARELHGLAAFGWAFTAFLVTNVVGMVIAGQLSDARGPRLPMVCGMALFVAGLVIAGTATTMLQLILARGVQGLGSGLLITAVYVLIGITYPGELQPKVFTATSAAWLLPSLLGPLVSGLVTQHLSWRWVFLGLLPFLAIGCALMVPVLRLLHGGSPHGHSALADPRRILRALVVAGGVAAFEGAGQHPSVLAVLVAIAGVAAVIWGIRGLVPPGTFQVRPGVGSAVALRALLAGSFFGAETVLPLMLNVQHGLGPTAAGLPLAVSGIVWGFGSWWQARERAGDDELRRVRLLQAGFASLVIALALIAVTTLPGAPVWLAYPGWGFAGLGAGLAMTTANVLLLRHTTDLDRGRDSAALQLGDTTFSALTTGVAGVLVAAAARGALGYTTSFVAIFVAMLAVAMVGLAVSGRARTLRR